MPQQHGLHEHQAGAVDQQHRHHELENLQVLRNTPFDSIGSPPNIVKLFGGKEGYLRAVRDLEDLIYEVA